MTTERENAKLVDLESYKYAWWPGCTTTLDEFLAQYKPSIIRDDGSKPFILVSKEKPVQRQEHEDAVSEAKEYLKEVTTKVEAIKNDDSIPIRSNKKKGLKSKKELREELGVQASNQLKELCVEHGFVSGKWLLFAEVSWVDSTFAKLATSLITGSLYGTTATSIKVMLKPIGDESAPSSFGGLSVNVYFPNAYSEEEAKAILKILLREHGLKPAGVKTDLFTAIGLDSKHASGIPSTVWSSSGGGRGLLKEEEVKTLRDAYFAEVNEKKVTGISTKAKATKDGEEEDDPFASDKEEDKPRAGAGDAKTVGVGNAKGKKRVQAEESGSEDNKDAPPKKVAKTSSSAAAAIVGGPKTRPRPAPKVGKRKVDSDSDE